MPFLYIFIIIFPILSFLYIFIIPIFNIIFFTFSINCFLLYTVSFRSFDPCTIPLCPELHSPAHIFICNKERHLQIRYGLLPIPCEVYDYICSVFSCRSFSVSVKPGRSTSYSTKILVCLDFLFKILCLLKFSENNFSLQNKKRVVKWEYYKSLMNAFIMA